MIFKIIAFFLYVYGLFSITGISLISFASALFTVNEKKILLSKRNKHKNRNSIGKYINDTKTILCYTRKEKLFDLIALISTLGAVVSFAVLIFSNNYLLAIPVSIIVFIAPIVYINIQAKKWLHQINNNLENALNIITDSYYRNEKFILAVKENMEFLKPPIKEVFQNFLITVESVDSNIPKALINMKKEIKNKIFNEWIDAVIDCHRDTKLISTLRPIIEKLAYTREIANEIRPLIYPSVKTFFTLILIGIVCFPLALLVINYNWLLAMFTTLTGQIVLCVGVIVIALCSYRVLNISKQAQFMDEEV